MYSGEFDVLVVGGGPAGIAAAARAAESGARIGLVDDNPNLGGQIWRGESESSASPAGVWLERVRQAGVQQICSTQIFDQPAVRTLLADGPVGSYELRYRKLVLATGARERFLPFPGWTLPNVVGAGGLQAFVKSGLAIAGKRVVVAGTGPLLLAVAGYLRGHGANVVMICEQASRKSIARFGLSLARYPSKLAQALSLRKELARIKLLLGAWVTAAEGDHTLSAVMISHGERQMRVACDYLACGFHLVPNIELASLLGCGVRNGFVAVDEFQRTSKADVFCAGEPTGIGGMELSLLEGQIAGLAAIGRESEARKLFGERPRLRDFADLLDRTFALRAELKKLASTNTIVCRCEDVTYGRLAKYSSWRSAKLQTRCGMGPCQGRVCGSATEFLFGWKMDSVRPPVFPTTVENLSEISKP